MAKTQRVSVTPIKSKIKTKKASNSVILKKNSKIGLKSIYHPRSSKDDNDGHQKKKLKWADENGSSFCTVTKLKVPPIDKSNWWHREDPVEITAAWTTTVAPGKGKTLFLTPALQQSLSITQMSAAYESKSKSSTGAAKIYLSYCETDTPTSETPRKQIMIGHLKKDQSRKIKIRIPSGTFHIINKGTVPASLHGMIESLYIKMT